MPREPDRRPAEQHIVIRPVGRDDANGLEELYEGLDLEGRLHRFFSAYHPPAGFFAKLAAVEKGAGARFVAVLEGSPGADRIVGEAGYEVLASGDGELTLTIPPLWWARLAQPLLDALLAQAAAAGVEDLEIDVLPRDHATMALLRARGAVIASHEGWAVTRLRVGTRGGPPTWPPARGRRRLLVEAPGGRWPGETAAEDAGFDVLTCPGPMTGPCPALAGEACELASSADAVVVSHPTDDERWRALVAAHPVVHTGVPVTVEPGACPIRRISGMRVTLFDPHDE